MKKTAFILLSVCLYLTAFSQTIYNNQTVELTMSGGTYTQNIIIKSGTHVRLPASNTVFMDVGTSITIEKGAKFYVQGSIVHSWSTIMTGWYGITVHGDANVMQPSVSSITSSAYPLGPTNPGFSGGPYTPSSHGVLIIGSGATLSGMKNIESVDGGIVYCNAATLKFPLDFTSSGLEFKDYSFWSSSRILGCDIELLVDGVPGAHPHRRLVNFSKVKGIQIDNTDFNVFDVGINTNVYYPSAWAITSFNSNFRVTNSTFTNYFQGIDVNGYNTQFAVIDNSEFNNCRFGIGSTGSSTTITNCDFNLGGESECGISLVGVNIFNVSGNDVQDAGISPFYYTTGAFLMNTGPFGTMIRNNNFTDCPVGIEAQQDNTGLQIKCNNFTNGLSNTTSPYFYNDVFDVSVTGTGTAFGIPNQGQAIIDPTGKYPAGNVFSINQCGTGGSSDPINDEANITKYAFANNFSYYHHQLPPANYFPQCHASGISPVNTTISTTSNACNNSTSIGGTITILDDNISKRNSESNMQKIRHLTLLIQSDLAKVTSLYLLDTSKQDSARIFLEGYEDDDIYAKVLLVPLYIAKGNFSAANGRLTAIAAADTTDSLQSFIDFYQIYSYVEQNNISHDALDGTRYSKMEAIAHANNFMSGKAMSWLKLNYDEDQTIVILPPKEPVSEDFTIPAKVASNYLKGEIKTYPNPAFDNLTLELPAGTNVTNYEISISNLFDVKMPVKYTYTNNIITFDLTTLTQGIYLVNIKDKNSSVGIIEKITKIE